MTTTPSLTELKTQREAIARDVDKLIEALADRYRTLTALAADMRRVAGRQHVLDGDRDSRAVMAAMGQAGLPGMHNARSGVSVYEQIKSQHGAVQ